jgi:hypothetical protein
MKKCDCKTIAINIVDEITVEIHCVVHGNYYLFKNDQGAWESAAARMARMRRVDTCQGCGDPIIHYSDHGGINRTTCNKCLKDDDIEYQRIMAINNRDNKNSPWRIGQKRKK